MISPVDFTFCVHLSILLFYLALLAAVALLAASAFFLYQEFFAAPAEAVALVSSFLA